MNWHASPGEWALAAHAATTGYKKGDGEKSPDHVAINWTRKSNSGKATMSNRTPSSAGTWAFGARAFITAIATSPTEYISPDKTRQNNIDSKCPLADNLQLAPWPPQYRAAHSLKYYGESDPWKFLMSYEAAITSFGGDKITLTKSFIISLENATANWYARLPSRTIISWAHLKKKFLVNFQGFQKDVSTEEDFFSCQQYERETLPDFFRRFLRLKAQAPEVSDEQVIMHAIKALLASQLHSHLVRERSRTLEEMYEKFQKFSKAEVLHFHKLG
jgi:hypothetical protein